MADLHSASDAPDTYVHGSQPIDEQRATFALFQGLAKWGSMLTAATLAMLTVWFMPNGSFIAAAIVFVVIVGAGVWFLRKPKSAAH
jgi:hypothetical protein